jgi:cation diffusion facilitator CzcD-associated flavoprotein CzcO
MKHYQAVVIGAGCAGLGAAIALKQKGHPGCCDPGKR